MQLNLQTDYALRLLIYLTFTTDRAVPVSEVATAYGISVAHLGKVAQKLARLGHVDAVRGNKGGVRLALDAREIRVGTIVREMEPDLAPVGCITHGLAACTIDPACTLKQVLIEASAAFMRELDRWTLADVARQRAELRPLLHLGTPRQSA